MITTTEMRRHLERINSSGPTRPNSLYPSPDVCAAEIKALTQALGVSKRHLAVMLNLPQLHHVYQWYSGRRRPNTFYLLRIAHLLRLAAQGRLDIINFDGSTYWESRGTLKKCVNSQAVYPLSEQHGLEAQERRYTAHEEGKH